MAVALVSTNVHRRTKSFRDNFIPVTRTCQSVSDIHDAAPCMKHLSAGIDKTCSILSLDAIMCLLRLLSYFIHDTRLYSSTQKNPHFVRELRDSVSTRTVSSMARFHVRVSALMDACEGRTAIHLAPDETRRGSDHPEPIPYWILLCCESKMRSCMKERRCATQPATQSGIRYFSYEALLPS